MSGIGATTLVLAGAALALCGCSSGADGDGADRTTRSATGPAPMIATRDPIVVRAYMGVSCRPAASVECDRVGLAVWLRRPAARVSATIAGRPLRLDDPVWSGPARRGVRTRFAGFLEPAGLVDGPLSVTPEPDGRWTGRVPVSARVGVLIVRRDGRTERTSFVLGLSPGWG